MWNKTTIFQTSPVSSDTWDMSNMSRHFSGCLVTPSPPLSLSQSEQLFSASRFSFSPYLWPHVGSLCASNHTPPISSLTERKTTHLIYAKQADKKSHSRTAHSPIWGTMINFAMDRMRFASCHMCVSVCCLLMCPCVRVCACAAIWFIPTRNVARGNKQLEMRTDEPPVSRSAA